MQILLGKCDSAVVSTLSLCFDVRWPETSVLHAQLSEYGIEITSGESPYIVILDLGLQDMDGFDVCSDSEFL